jgi:hypothetical protein
MLYYIKNVTLFIIFNFANLLLLSALWIKKKFGDVGLESIYFTLKTPLDGVPNRVLFSYSKRIFFSILASLIMIFIIYYTLKKLKNKKLKHILTFAIPLTYCLVVTLIAINPYIDIIKYSRQNSTFIDQNYEMVMPEDVIAPLKKKNCIFILAESFENSFNGEQTDFNIIPKLKLIQDENISFKN